MSVDSTAVIREIVAAVNSPVRLLFFEQSIGCDTCAPTRRLLDQLALPNPLITVEKLNLVLDADRAAECAVDRVPATIVTAPGRDRIRFYGAPLGHELMSLLEAVRMTATGETGLSEQTRSQLATLGRPVRIQVFFTPTCVYCPQMVNLANRFAAESPLVTTTSIDATEYPDLVRRYAVNGVPKTIVDDSIDIVGAAGEGDLIAAVLESACR